MFNQSELEDHYRNPAKHHSLKRNVMLFSLPELYGAATKVGTANLCEPADDIHGGLSRQKHKHPVVCDQSDHYIAIFLA